MMTQDRPIKLKFESDYRAKVLYMSFDCSSVLKDHKTIVEWRTQWMKELQSWHSPYKVMVDCTNLQVLDPDEKTSLALDNMLKFFKGLHLRAVVGFGFDEQKGHKFLPFEVYQTLKEASEKIGVRGAKIGKAGDFRSLIQFDNHFKEQIMELSFLQDVVFDSSQKLSTLKAKLLNNLMFWHSSWNLLIDCSNLEVKEDFFDEFKKIESFFQGFFMKKIVGYQPKKRNIKYPFVVTLSRHQAVTMIGSIKGNDGDLANCQDRKKR